jgi:hypothetical protein
LHVDSLQQKSTEVSLLQSPNMVRQKQRIKALRVQKTTNF